MPPSHWTRSACHTSKPLGNQPIKNCDSNSSPISRLANPIMATRSQWKFSSRRGLRHPSNHHVIKTAKGPMLSIAACSSRRPDSRLSPSAQAGKTASRRQTSNTGQPKWGRNVSISQPPARSAQWLRSGFAGSRPDSQRPSSITVISLLMKNDSKDYAHPPRPKGTRPLGPSFSWVKLRRAGGEA